MRRSKNILLVLILVLTLLGCTTNDNVHSITPTHKSATTVTETSFSADTPTTSTPTIPAILEPPQFNFRFERLTIKTSRMDLEIKNGTVVFLRDKETSEVLIDSDAKGQCELGNALTAGYISKDLDGNITLHCPTHFQNVTFTASDEYRGKLTYQGLPDSAQSRLELDIAVDPQTGEVLVTLTGFEVDDTLRPVAINLTLMSLETPSVILGSGVKTIRTDPATETQTTEAGYGLYAPSVAVIEGEKSVAALWSESAQFAPEYIRLIHTPQKDHLILHSGRDPKQINPQQITGAIWRIGVYPNWVDAAARWKQSFEQRTGAKPLWENRAEWARNIHAVFDSTNQLYGDNPEKYDKLAKLASPKKVLFYLWNGDRIVLFGDHTLATQIGRPDPDMLSAIEKYGWPLLLYHPFNLIYTENGASKRLSDLSARGWLPTNYTFKPDYQGAPTDWFKFWEGHLGNYDETISLIHPGSTQFKEYIVTNFGDYARRYKAKAAYMDVLGNDGNAFFSEGSQVIDGQDYVLGEKKSVELLNQELPDLGIMSEYQASWLTPYTFYTWEGVETHLRQAEIANVHINHPLRTALLGSYMWTKESNSGQIDDILAALLGTLPEVSLVGDYEVTEERALWSQERTKLFCDEELFNALPPIWDDNVLAYYQSQRTGHWFKFVKIEATYGYIEILPNGGEIIRLVK